MNQKVSITKKNGKQDIQKFFKIAPTCFITWMAIGYILPVQAVVIADINQGKVPAVLANSNGSITVNINAASAGGISHNKYLQFDAATQGVILNNSAGSAEKINTTLAGEITGNKNITKDSSASLIINEVTSNRRSQLNGKIEVAGTKADVIIVNPAGISCNGCGFINAGRSTLTTGKLTIANDKLSGINVTSGNITLTGQGMKDESDYTALLAQTVNINANLKAKNLQVMTGVNNNITVSNNQLVNTGGSGTASYYPSIGLDVSALGGMFANKITLVANQSGIGVNNRGLINATTDLNINYKGAITNTGKLRTNSGDILLLATSMNNNTGSINSGRDIEAIVATSINNVQGRIGAIGSIITNGLTVNNNQGFITGNNISITANNITNSNSSRYIIHEEDIPRTITINDDTKGGLRAKSDINLNSNGLLEGSAGWIASNAGDISLTSNAQIILNYSRISGKNINVSSDTLDYPARVYPDPIDAKIYAKNDINLNIGNLGLFDRTTVLDAGRDINFTSRDGKKTGTFSNYGIVSAKNNVNFNHGNITNFGVISSGNDTNIKSRIFINNNAISSNRNTDITATTSFLNNTTGSIFSMGKTSLRSPNVNNQGNIISRTGTDVSSNSFTNKGYISGEVTKLPFNI